MFSQAVVDSWLAETSGTPGLVAAPKLSILFSTIVTTDINGTVHEPLNYDVMVSPGEPVQAAVDLCPNGGSVLLLPGIHNGPLGLHGKEVHVFGRGLATLRVFSGIALSSSSARATTDGLKIESAQSSAVSISSGRLRMQACDITAVASHGIEIHGGDPVIAKSRCAEAAVGELFYVVYTK